MALDPVRKVVVRDFPGLRTNADPEDIRAGEGQVQTNVRSERPGEMRVRQGTCRVKFED